MAVKKSRRKSTPVKKSAPRTKAQIEFDRHRAKYEAERAASSVPGYGSAVPPSFQPTASGQVPQGIPYGSIPSWGLPPSVAPLPLVSATGVQVPGAGAAAGPLGDRLGSTLRLGVEVLNAGLSGGLRFLSGLSGAAYGYGIPAAAYDYDCGCGEAPHCCCYMQDCCECGHPHCEDCCCRPSVGNCCC